MELSRTDLELLVQLVSEKYDQTFNEYRGDSNNGYNFSRLIDIQQLRKKIVDELNKKV